MNGPRIAVNGMGRIGRLVVRAALGGTECPALPLNLVHLNEVKGDAATCAHLMEFDSVHGRWRADIRAAEDRIHIGEHLLRYTAFASPKAADWRDAEIDIVIEASGKFKTPEDLAPYFEAGIKKVIVAAPVKQDALNIVMGVNDHLYEPDRHHLITAASCTTNCLAPVVKVIHETFGIVRGQITTIHDVTNTQVMVDAPHKDLRRARSALNSLIPTTTGSARTIGTIFPELNGKLDGHAVRVPLLNASLTDCVFEVGRDITAEDANAALRAAAEGPLKGILGYEDRPLVSADYVNDTRSSIVDALSTLVVDGRSLKIFAWYDNEIGYARRLAELTGKVVRAMRESRS